MTYSLLACGLRLTGPALDPLCGIPSSRPVGCDLELGAAHIVLQIEGIVCFSNVLKLGCFVQPLDVVGTLIFCLSLPLLLGLLRADDALLSKASFQSFQLRARHCC